MLSSGPHDEFLELCAASASGQLNPEEQARLKEHLLLCSDCREALREYETVVNYAIPVIASEDLTEVDPGPGWSESKAEKALFKRLAKEQKRAGSKVASGEGLSSFRRFLPVAPESTWWHVWMLYASGILLFVTLGLSAYWVGIRRGTESATDPRVNIPQSESALQNQIAALEEQLSDAGHEAQIARSESLQKDKMLAALRRELERETTQIEQAKNAQAQLDADLRSTQNGKDEQNRQRVELERKLATAESESRDLRTKVDALAYDSSNESAQAKTLQARVDDLTRLLDNREKTIEHQEQLLAHDRDIRDLMGARDLYIAEVYDVDDTGTTRKPYGRVFYTKGKSLIFYAYDLDQLGTKRAQAFQVWGRRGPNWHEALNLGIFFEDNTSKKRWVLKLDDPETLAQIDGVFVTVEPHGGSDKPSGKPLLAAYLRLNPNHP